MGMEFCACELCMAAVTGAGACRVLIASIMEEYSQPAWEEIVRRCEEVGVDGFEINFSCPHGMPERRMGMAMGQDPDILSEVPCPPPAWHTTCMPHCAWPVHVPCGVSTPDTPDMPVCVHVVSPVESSPLQSGQEALCTSDRST